MEGHRKNGATAFEEILPAVKKRRSPRPLPCPSKEYKERLFKKPSVFPMRPIAYATT